MRDEPEWPETVDRAVLRDLTENGPDYAPLVANRCGLNRKTVERCCDRLVAEGYLERVSGEPVYRATEAAAEKLAALRDAPGAPTQVAGEPSDE